MLPLWYTKIKGQVAEDETRSARLMFARLGLALILILAATALPPPPLPVLPCAGEVNGLGMEDPGGVHLTGQAETLEGNDNAAGGPCYCHRPDCEDCPRCEPRQRGDWAVGLGHFYADHEGRDGYAWQVMANGQPMNPNALTIAVRIDLLEADAFRLGDAVRLTSACGVVTATVTDAMPMMPAFAQGVIVDVSPAVAGRLFCEGYGHNGEGIAYGEELVLVERLRAK